MPKLRAVVRRFLAVWVLAFGAPDEVSAENEEESASGWGWRTLILKVPLLFGFRSRFKVSASRKVTLDPLPEDDDG